MSLQYFESQNLNIECENIVCSTINGNPVNPGGGENLTQTLTVGNNANNLSIENLQILNLQNPGNTSSVDIKTLAGDVLTIVKGGSGVSANVTAGSIQGTQLKLIDANNITLDNTAGTDPSGNLVNTLNVTNGSGGSAQINVGSAQIGLLEIQSSQNQIYFLQALNTTAVGAPAGRLPVILNGVTYYLQVFSP